MSFDPEEVSELLADTERPEPVDSNQHAEHRYTISFINGTPGLVVRSDYSTEMEQAIRDILPIFKRFKEAVETKKPVQTETSQLKSICKEHGVEMKSGISKKTGNEYWFHKNADGAICFGKGYQEKGY